MMLLKPSIWQERVMLRGNDPDGAVFRSRKGGGRLDPVQAHRIVKQAAACPLSHALDRGAATRAVLTRLGHGQQFTTQAPLAHRHPAAGKPGRRQKIASQQRFQRDGRQVLLSAPRTAILHWRCYRVRACARHSETDRGAARHNLCHNDKVRRRQGIRLRLNHPIPNQLK